MAKGHGAPTPWGPRTWDTKDLRQSGGKEDRSITRDLKVAYLYVLLHNLTILTITNIIKNTNKLTITLCNRIHISMQLLICRYSPTVFISFIVPWISFLLSSVSLYFPYLELLFDISVSSLSLDVHYQRRITLRIIWTHIYWKFV
jgi:hypothetical protein